MEPYLSITQINDFIFCPRSIIYHDVFRNTSAPDMYQQKPQLIGQAAHKNIDEGRYSSRKDVLSGIFVYCEQYSLLGRIDVFDCRTGILTERKYSITAVYDGFRYQLYAQYLALKEMGYEVKALRLHSKKDNKNYPIALPNDEDLKQFSDIILSMQHYSPLNQMNADAKRCCKCIYNTLCELYIEN